MLGAFSHFYIENQKQMTQLSNFKSFQFFQKESMCKDGAENWLLKKLILKEAKCFIIGQEEGGFQKENSRSQQDPALQQLKGTKVKDFV